MDDEQTRPQQDPDLTLAGSSGDPSYRSHVFNQRGFCRHCEKKRVEVSERPGRPAISCTADAAQLIRDDAKLRTATSALAQAIEGFNADVKARRLAQGEPAEGVMIDAVGQRDEA